MTIVNRSILIHASPEAVMAALSDARHWPEWYPGMTQSNPDNRFPEKGGKVTFTVKSGFISFQITETALDFQPGKLQLLQMEGMMSGKARWELTPEGDGTRLNTTFDYTMTGGPLGKIADTLIVKRQNAGSLEAGLNNLKTLLEGR
jgi:carbon monoxide dehydrogenase subunit G